jgi:hypothetical protein
VPSGALGCLLALQLTQVVRPAAAAEIGAAAALDEQFRRGEQAWRASCPKPTEDGSCVEIQGTAHHRRRVVVDRDPALAAEAQRRFLMVATLWRRLGGGELPGARQSAHPWRAPSVHQNYATIFHVDPGMDPQKPTEPVAAAPPLPAEAGAAHAAAGAAFYLAEAQWEAYLRIGSPLDSSLSSPHGPWRDEAIGEAMRKGGRRLQRRFEAFLSRKLDQLARTRQLYLTVFAMRQAPFDVAAAARIGQLYDAFDDDTAGDPLDDKAVAAFERCFDTAAKSARYDEWFRLCEHQLTVLRPSAFPEVDEFVPEANHAESKIVPVPPISRLE